MNRFVAVTLGAALAASVSAADKVDFRREVRPILEGYCLKCHGVEKPKGELSLVTRSGALKGGEKAGPAVVAGKPSKSPLYITTTFAADNDDVMPPKGDKLTKAQQEKLKTWIEQGADWPEDQKLSQKERVDFVKQVAPILEVSCVACHREGHAKGKLRLDVREEFFKSDSVVVGDGEKSKLYTSMILKPDDEDLMPPAKKGGPLPREKADIIRNWIDQGAQWPAGLLLRQKEAASTLARDDAAMLAAIHAKVLATSLEKDPAAMKAFTESLSGTDGAFDMVPIPAGEFTMGTPDNEPGHKPNEGPPRRLKIEPFWMGKLEVRWNEYELFMFPGLEKGTNVPTERVDRELLMNFPDLLPAAVKTAVNQYTGKEAEAVSRPTTPYVEMSFGMGKDGFPAISMTHYAATRYCRWLTAKTGHFYRLATEAEWEYACRAGTSTRYFFGDDPAKIDDYAWHFKNADGKYQKVGKKKPNPWGLYDMIGNVAEWVMDGYVDSYAKVGDRETVFIDTEYPNVARGGSWDDDPELLRSGARLASDASWKMRDPQLPKSKWYLTDAQFLGLRVVRPLKVPATPEEMGRWWPAYPTKR